MIKNVLLCIWFLFLHTAHLAQDADEYINKLTEKFGSVKDYSVRAKIKSDIPLVKILTVNATVYFKQKDKFKIDADGIAILPRQGIGDVPKLLNAKNTYKALLTGTENISNVNTQIITILPSTDTTDLILAKLWYDGVSELILKSQVTTRSSGTVSTDYFYSTQKQYGLPDSMVFTVDVKKFKIPKGVATDINRTQTTNANKPPSKTGKIFIRLYNYKTNTGLKDELFAK